MRGITAACLLALVVSFGLSLQPQQASACSCFVPSIDGGLDENERGLLMEIARDSDVLMKARVLEASVGRPYVSTLVPTQIYRGERRARYQVESLDCNGIIADFEPGEIWLVALSSSETTEYRAHGCTSHPAGSEYGAAYEEYFGTTGGSTPVAALAISAAVVAAGVVGFLLLRVTGQET